MFLKEQKITINNKNYICRLLRENDDFYCINKRSCRNIPANPEKGKDKLTMTVRSKRYESMMAEWCQKLFCYAYENLTLSITKELCYNHNENIRNMLKHMQFQHCGFMLKIRF